MQENFEMRWLINAFDRAKIHEERIDCSKVALKALLLRQPTDQPIDVAKVVNEALVIGKSMVAGFVEEKLI